MRNLLFSIVNKEFLIFLFFLALSGVFWLITTLNETYEYELNIPVKMVGVPKNVVVTSDPVDTIKVTVRDKGYSLAAYRYANRIQPVSIKFQDYANHNAGKGTVSGTDIQKQLRTWLYGSSKITSVKPDRLEFYFNYGLSKKVPVYIAGKIEPSSRYYIARKHIQPDSVTIYARKALLDSVRYVYTERLNILNFEDTIIRDVSLQRLQGVKIEPKQVKIAIYPDILTEQSVEVPIVAIGMPQGKVLRTFPSRVKVHFVVGVSQYRSIKPSQFTVVANYKELLQHPSDKCNLYLRTMPRGVRNVRLDIKQVDYLIEQQ